MTHSPKLALTRRQLLTTGLTGAAIIGAPGIMRANAAVTLRAAHIESTESATHKGYMNFAKLVEEATGGSVQVKVFPAGQLGNLRDLYEGLKLGSVDITSSGPDYSSNLAPIMVTAALFYSYRDSAHADKLLEGEFSERLSEALLKQAGMRILAWGELGWRSVFNTVRPIKTANDFKGLKLRVPEAKLMLEPMKALGASPTPIPYSEVYTSMQTGVVDGAEGAPAAVVQQKFNEVSKYYSMTRHLYNPIHLVIGASSYDKLSAEQKKAVELAARDAFRAQRSVARADNEAALEKVKAAGLEVNDVDTDPLREIVQPVWNDLTKDLGAEGQALIKLLKA
ncbi:TRAP transporter substrate-binding protein [Cohaesibacter haloalkalitolerans]|uniref:TRAP transporter substrate-binding protein n=1 Tax=Cohaesibacter haloalkalitolerans TaxID=1162980 RepID=UPI000E65DA4C|nr:TRAP transporter substrate-binding protein [Cohaesibacter haloalkalitolerans]